MKRILCLVAALALAAISLSAGEKPKTIVLLGDSYTTFEGLIPEGYSCWYFKDHAAPAMTDGKHTNDVHKASQTWWNIFVRKARLKLLLNSSYSGATISSSGYGHADYSDRSFVTRAKTDIVDPQGKPGRCGEIPDIVLIFGGTNDCWVPSPVGEVLPADCWRDADLTQTMPSTSYLLGYLKETLPDTTRIVFVVNTELGKTFETSFAQACEIYGVECIQLHDIDKLLSHPSKVGMKQIASQVQEAMGL